MNVVKTMNRAVRSSRKLALGTMQGRLLPKYQGRYQAHPVGYWQEEFTQAKAHNLDLIEFILDFNDWETNPLMTNEGISAIEALTVQTGVGVKTICADYFMVAPLFGISGKELKQNLKVLKKLMITAQRLGVSDIGLACLEKTSLRHQKSLQNEFVNNLSTLMSVAEKLKVNLSLEMDLDPGEFREFLTGIKSPAITVTYDTGNSASFGYDPAEELEAFGDRITDIHLKDRVLNGGSVILGTGNADFDRFLTAFSRLNYSGPIILQAFRDDEGIKVFERQKQWVKDKFSEYGYHLGS